MITPATATSPAAATVAVADAEAAAQADLATRLALMIYAILTAYQPTFGIKNPSDQVKQIVDAIEQAQRIAVLLAASYVTAALRAAGSTATFTPYIVPPDTDRAAIEARWAPLLEQAESVSREDVEALARQEITDAVSDGTHRFIATIPKVIGYRRVIHPEMSKGGTCGLCAVASTAVYSHGNLRKIHANCNCQVLPITRDADPGDLLNRHDLKDLYEAAGGTTDGWTLKQARIRTDDKGEVVVVKKRDKRGPVGSSPAAKGATMNPATLKTMSDDGIRHQIALTESLKDSKWRTEQLRRLAREAKRRGL